MMIRARARDHLVRLMDRFPSLKRYTLIRSLHNDYRFRIIIPKWRWQRVMRGLIREQDYDNFKGEVDRTFGTETDEQRRYHDKMLVPMWSVAYRFQTSSYGPGIYDREDDLPVQKKDKRTCKRKPKPKPETQDVQTGLHPFTGTMSSSKAAPVDVETSPFEPEEGPLVQLGPEPFEHAQVLVVLDQDTGQEVVVVWCPGLYGGDNGRAYADAIQAQTCGVVAHPEYQRMPWRDAKKGGAPVFDPAAELTG